jgi:hypothetical protein
MSVIYEEPDAAMGPVKVLLTFHEAMDVMDIAGRLLSLIFFRTIFLQRKRPLQSHVLRLNDSFIMVWKHA